MRAVESLRPPHARWCFDPLAAAFLEPWHRPLLAACAQSQALRDGVEGMLDWRYPGVVQKLGFDVLEHVHKTALADNANASRKRSADVDFRISTSACAS